jgi:uncharacterized protein YneF (UPF0154 family)
MLAGLFFALKPYFNGLEALKEDPEMVFSDLNTLLIFMGLSISFSSLQDTTKTQNKLSQRIWENPVKGKIAIVVICGIIAFNLLYGLTGYFITEKGIIKDLSLGAIVLGLGMFGMLKAAVEMFENHRKDKRKS